MTPGMVPSTIGAPTFRISVSIIGPRPTLSLPVSQLAAACIILKMGTCRGHSCSHFPQPMHLLNTSTSGWRLLFLAASMESPTSSRFGHAWLHMLHSLWSLQSPGTSPGLTRVLSLFGPSSRATLTATSAALSGSNIKACFPLSVIALMISPVFLSVKSSRP